MNLIAAAVLLVSLAVPAESEPVSEARIHIAGRHEAAQFRKLLGDLYIVTVGSGEDDDWLLVQAHADRLAEAAALGFRVEVTWPDIRDKFYSVTGVDPNDPDGGRNYGFYINYAECIDTLRSLATRYPDLCSLFSLGPSYRGNDIWCLKLSDNPATDEAEPECLFDGAIHANEPVGTSTVIMFAEHLLGGYGEDSLATWLLDNRQVYVAPILNPDGVIYNSDSGGASANWRKNRHPYPPGDGVDLNRNFGYKWGFDDQGSSPNPRNWNYRGPAPFSEPEAQAVRDFVLDRRIRTMIDFHMSGHWNLFPWCYDSIRSPELPYLNAMAETLRSNNHYPSHKTGQCAWKLYECNGVMIDWYHTDSGGKFPTQSFVLETGDDMWVYWNDSAGLRHECELNIPNLYYLTRAAGAWFSPYRIGVVDTAHGNGNRRLDPGEVADVWCAIRNQAVHPADSAYAMEAVLRSRHSDVCVLDSTWSPPSAGRQEQVNNIPEPFLVDVNPGAEPGDTVRLELALQFTADGQEYTQQVPFELILGRSSTVAEDSVSGFPPPVLATLLAGRTLTCPTHARLIDVTGRRVARFVPGENDIGHLSPGVYFVTGADRSDRHRLVLTR